MLKIVTIPNPVLTTATQPVTVFDARLRKIVRDMEEALIACVDPQGVGLAATQVGLSMSLFIIKPEPDVDTRVFINPRIIHIDELKPEPPETKKKKKHSLEGCLSIPRIWAPVRRPATIEVEYQDIDGVKHRERFEGFDSIIIQHEIDHLQGVLFTVRALEQNTPLYEEKDGELERVEF